MSQGAKGLPSRWAIVPLEEILESLSDGRVIHHGWSPQCEKLPATSTVEWGVLKTTACQDGLFLPEHNKRLPPHLAPRSLLEVATGDILITVAGPRARCGVACLVRSTRPRLMISGKMLRFRVPDGRVDPRYIEAFLRAPDTQAAIDRMKTGISDSGLNFTQEPFRQLAVLLAPSREQQRIADALDDHFTRLDAVGEALRRARARMKRFRASLLQAAVEGRLVPTEADLARREGRSYEPASALLARVLAERRNRLEATGKRRKHVEPAAPVAAALVTLPEGWSCVPFDVACECVSDRGARLQQRLYMAEGMFPVIDQGEECVGGYTDDATMVVSSPLPLIVFGDHTRRFKLVDRPFVVGADGVKLLAPVREMWDPRFLVAALRNARFPDRGYSRHFQFLRRIVIPLPPYAEQARIADALAEVESNANAWTDQLLRSDRAAGRLRQSILRLAFEGRLVDPDPTDEPASALLSHIRASRDQSAASRSPKQRRNMRRRSTTA